jgi:hypothetical protein
MDEKDLCNAISSPNVLLADTNRWDIGARLAVGLARAGCSVSAICPARGHALRVTRAVKSTFAYRASDPISSLREAIETAKPDLVIPSCERSVEHLHELYGRVLQEGPAGDWTRELIERSLGSPFGYPIVSSRYDLLALAIEEGIRVPETIRVTSRTDLDAWRGENLDECVIKADGTWGGGGVRVLRESESSERPWEEVTKASRLLRAVKRLVVNRDPFYLRAWLNHVERPIIAQRFIGGRPANCSVFAWKGEVVGMIEVEALLTYGATGCASVVQLIENQEMKIAAENIAARLGLSGFFGLDFIIEKDSDRAFLIEMNPRLTPPCYLRLEKGRDLVGAVWASITGEDLPDNVPVTRSDLIVYQPEMLGRRDLPQGGYYPTLDDEPELAQELKFPFPSRTMLFRLTQMLERKPADAAKV